MISALAIAPFVAIAALMIVPRFRYRFVHGKWEWAAEVPIMLGIAVLALAGPVLLVINTPQP